MRSKIALFTIFFCIVIYSIVYAIVLKTPSESKMSPEKDRIASVDKYISDYFEKVFEKNDLMPNFLNNLIQYTAPTTKLAAVIVEPRNHKHLITVIENMLDIFPDIKIYIFHGKNNKELVKNIQTQHINKIILYNIGVENLNIYSYNYLLTRTEFYKSIPSTHILVFQTDSILFTKSTVDITNYFKYSYVGAPWKHSWPHTIHNKKGNYLNGWICSKIGNGGLSLRNRSDMIEALDRYPYEKSSFPIEDVYFGSAMMYLGKKMPTTNVAACLFFESVYSKEAIFNNILPLGAHKFIPHRLEKYLTTKEISVLIATQ